MNIRLDQLANGFFNDPLPGFFFFAGSKAMLPVAAGAERLQKRIPYPISNDVVDCLYLLIPPVIVWMQRFDISLRESLTFIAQ